MATRALSGPPHTLSLYVRAAAPLLPGASRLPFVAGGGGEIPDDLELTLPAVQVDPRRLAAYERVCGFANDDPARAGEAPRETPRETLPATYPHVLAFGLHMALMTDGRFPFGAMGLVHVSNRIVQHRPIGLAEPLELRVHATPLQAHPRGRTFSLVSRARVGDELVWEDHSTMLRRGGGAGDRAGAGAAHDEQTEPTPPRETVWNLSGDLGRRYAAVSGDRNPIHMHDLTAKLFGFPRAIAHGMWTKARCLAALEQRRLPDAFSVEVRFRRPILLPAQVAFGVVEEGDDIRFGVRDAGTDTNHLDGRVQPIDDASAPRTSAAADVAPVQTTPASTSTPSDKESGSQ
jgi:acyl dehydratase